jgi:hypothetical protein
MHLKNVPAPKRRVYEQQLLVLAGRKSMRLFPGTAGARNERHPVLHAFLRVPNECTYSYSKTRALAETRNENKKYQGVISMRRRSRRQMDDFKRSILNRNTILDRREDTIATPGMAAHHSESIP